MAWVIMVCVVGILIEAGVNYYFWGVTSRWSEQLDDATKDEDADDED